VVVVEETKNLFCSSVEKAEEVLSAERGEFLAADAEVTQRNAAQTYSPAAPRRVTAATAARIFSVVDGVLLGVSNTPLRTYPFNPVIAIPWMNSFWVKKKRMITGAITIADAAISKFHDVPPFWLW
jgi:hypothetical protein